MVCEEGVAYPVAMLPPPPERHAANLTRGVCQHAKFGPDRPSSLVVVACQRLVDYLALRGRGVVGTESSHRLRTAAIHSTSSTSAEVM